MNKSSESDEKAENSVNIHEEHDLIAEPIELEIRRPAYSRWIGFMIKKIALLLTGMKELTDCPNTRAEIRNH